MSTIRKEKDRQTDGAEWKLTGERGSGEGGAFQVDESNDS